ncbi:DgyrCDS11567 [Dimorphilus gyrociliatus]|nr:DgyrCDS11567 [Dimorphilus gyrociliatus]
MNHSELHYYNEIDCVQMLGIPLSFEEDEGSSVDREDDDVSALSKKYENINLFGNSETQKENFFESLPEEVIQLILLYLDTASLCNLASTCRLLHQHCYDRLLYKELDLQPYWPNIKDSSLESLTSRCRKLERINLSWCGGHNFISFNAFNKFLLNLEKNLIVLRLSGCEFLNDNCFDAICSNCPKLEELNIASCINTNEFSPLVRLNKLKKLNLYRTNIDYFSLYQFIMKCSSLEHLNIGSCSTLRNCGDIVVKLSNNCRNLKGLDIWRAKDITSLSINSLAECKQLEELDIGWCKVESNCGCLRKLAENCRKMKKLFLTATR